VAPALSCETTACALEPTDLRRVFGAYPTGVTAVAALVDGIPVGITANSFTSVSLDPPIVSVCVAHTSTTWPVLRKATRLGISVLGAHQEGHGRALSERRGDRFGSPAASIRAIPPWSHSAGQGRFMRSPLRARFRSRR